MPQRQLTTHNPATAPGFFLANGANRLFDLVTGPWALLPAMLTELQEIYCTHLRGEKIDVGAIEAALGRPLANEHRDYEVVDGVAVLSIQGAIAPKANLFTRISGGASAQLLHRDFAQALDDRSVSAIVLAIDSPGGSVYGSPDLARAIHAARGRKPIVAHSDGMLASAAYWIGAAADSVYISGQTVTVGSIGVLARHINRQSASVETEVTAGAYKRIASDTGPLTKEGRAYLQAQVDYLYSIFVDNVAAFRGVSTEQVLADMADGRVFIGQQAIDAGLVDGESSLSDLIARLASDPQSVTRRAVKPKANTTTRREPKALDALPAPAAAAGAAAQQEPQPEPVPLDTQSTNQGTHMDAQTFERDHSALYTQLQAKFRAEGAAAETARVAAVRAQALPGHEALIDKLAADGKTTGPEAAAAIVAAERARVDAATAAHKNDAPSPAATGAAPSDKPKTDAEKAAEATKLAQEKGISVVAALKELGYAA